MVRIAQLVEPRIVIPVVAGSNPVSHPKDMEQLGLLTRRNWTHKFLHETVKLWYNIYIGK